MADIAILDFLCENPTLFPPMYMSEQRSWQTLDETLDGFLQDLGAAVDEDKNLTDHGADSLDHAELVMAFEQKFDVLITEEEWAEIHRQRIGDLRISLARLLAKKGVRLSGE